MYGRYAARTLAAVLAGVTVIFGNAPARAGDPAGFVPTYSGPQFMLYMIWPVGSRGISASRFGLRYERTTPGYSDSAARFSAPLRHRSLVELEFARGVAPRMLFGPRVTWDMGSGELGPTSLVLATWRLPTLALVAAPPAFRMP